MTLGNFGVVEGFVFLDERSMEDADRFVCIGLPANECGQFKKGCTKLLTRYPDIQSVTFLDDKAYLSMFPPVISCMSLFRVAYHSYGILGLGKKLVGDHFDDEDKHLLETLVNNLVIVLKNARATDALKAAYEEVSSLNRAKDKLLNHLSHELRTPVSLLKTTLKLLKKPLDSLPEDTWQRTFERAERSVARLSEIQNSAGDIILKKEYRQYPMISKLLEQCTDVLEAVSVEQWGTIDLAAKVRSRIDEIYHAEEKIPEKIHLGQFIHDKLDELQTIFEGRQMNVLFKNQSDAVIYIPAGILDMVFTTLIKNAVENTPDEGRIDVWVRSNSNEAELAVHDLGVGIFEAYRRRIFEGFYPTQEIGAYATKKPFNFNAGGKGSELLRTKIFSERYHFKIDMTSSRCRNLPNAGDQCPGRISLCEHCQRPEDCHATGFSIFKLTFPVAS
jgi:signal transduction histidine kinase